MANINVGDELWIRGPYFNGLLGQREIQQCKGSKCLLLCKGIAMMPSIPVLQYLLANNNKVDVVLDRTNFDNCILEINLSLFEIEPELCTITNATGLTTTTKQRINDALSAGVTFIHIGASEYVIRCVTTYLKQIGRDDVLLSCCNNAKMCCGDAICGVCTERNVLHLHIGLRNAMTSAFINHN